MSLVSTTWTITKRNVAMGNQKPIVRWYCFAGRTECFPVPDELSDPSIGETVYLCADAGGMLVKVLEKRSYIHVFNYGITVWTIERPMEDIAMETPVSSNEKTPFDLWKEQLPILHDVFKGPGITYWSFPYAIQPKGGGFLKTLATCEGFSIADL